jgi:hypothetical protein
MASLRGNQPPPNKRVKGPFPPPNNSMEPTRPAECLASCDTTLGLARRLISRPLGGHLRENDLVDPYHFTILGLSLDIIGAFLVSVEAIKLDNLRALREKVIRPAYKATLSPAMEIIGDEMIVHASKRYLFVFTLLHYVAGLLLLLAVNALLAGRLMSSFRAVGLWLVARPWYVAAILAVLILVFGVIAGLWILGELVHMAIVELSKFPIRLLESIERRTPDGTVGIIGFFFLLSGFCFQIVGAFTGTRG